MAPGLPAISEVSGDRGERLGALSGARWYTKRRGVLLTRELV